MKVCAQLWCLWACLKVCPGIHCWWGRTVSRHRICLGVFYFYGESVKLAPSLPFPTLPFLFLPFPSPSLSLLLSLLPSPLPLPFFLPSPFFFFSFPGEPHVWLKHFLLRNLHHLGVVERRSGNSAQGTAFGAHCIFQLHLTCYSFLFLISFLILVLSFQPFRNRETEVLTWILGMG